MLTVLWLARLSYFCEGGDCMEENKQYVPIEKKFLLTIEETAAYTNIGTKKIRELIKERDGDFTVRIGSKYLIRRIIFEDYLNNHYYL